MKATYTPTKLISTLDIVRKTHPTMKDIMRYEPNAEFLEEVEQWSKLSEEDVAEKACFIPKHKIRLLAKYIPGNSLNLRLSSLTKIVLLRADEDIVKLLFILWQDYYLNRDLCELLKDLVEGTDFALRKIQNQSEITMPMLMDWFTKDTVPQSVGRDCLALSYQKSVSFPERLKAFHISPSSKLGQACTAEFLTFCGREDYLGIGDIDTFHILEKFDSKTIKLYLRNVLSKLQIQDFQRYYMCGSFLRDHYTGNTNSEKYKKFFESFSDDLELKYRRWLGYILIKDSFSNNTKDERVIFWSEFIPYTWNAYRIQISKSLVIEFASYCIVEFTTDSMGPIYIYKKSVFDKNIRWYINRHNDTELKQLLYHQLRNYATERKEHRGNWQSYVRHYLWTNSILT